MDDIPKKKQNEIDRYLPIANIGRIIKNNLPKEVKLSKDAKETFQACVSEFISFITSEASDNLGFEHYTSILKEYLEKYKESQKLINQNNIKENEEEKKI